MDAESIRYFNALIRNIFLIILAGALFAVPLYLYRSRQPITYVAETRILVSNILNNPDPNIGQINTSEQLVLIYAELARNYRVLSETIEKLSSDTTPEDLRRQIVTSSVTDTPILILRVSDRDSDVAVDTVNTLAETLIEQSPTLTSDQQNQLDILREQINDINSQIQQMDQQIVNVLEELTEANENDADIEVIDSLTAQYNRLVEQRTTSQATLAQISDTALQLSDRTNQLTILEEASRATPSGGISPVIISAAGGILGVLLAAVLVLLREYLNNTLRNEYEVATHLNRQILGSIPYLRSNHQALRNSTLATITTSAIGEDFRKLQANLLATNKNKLDTKLFAVASPNPGEGRTFIAINLAIMISQLDFKVLLIDSDMRQPYIHNAFNLEESREGLMSLLLNSPETMNAKKIEQALESRIVKSQQFENLSILPSGLKSNMRLPVSRRRRSWRLRRQNYDRKTETERLQVLGFNTLNKWLQTILDLQHYDVVIFDSPPSLAVADVYTIAFRVSADILLVVESGQTKISDAQKIIEEHETSGNTIRGVVLNKSHRNHFLPIQFLSGLIG